MVVFAECYKMNSWKYHGCGCCLDGIFVWGINIFVTGNRIFNVGYIFFREIFRYVNNSL